MPKAQRAYIDALIAFRAARYIDGPLSAACQKAERELQDSEGHDAVLTASAVVMGIP